MPQFLNAIHLAFKPHRGLLAQLFVCFLLCSSTQLLINRAIAGDSSRANSGTSRILKWKDEHGVTHYGDKIPPKYANQENTTMNRQGVPLQHYKPVTETAKAADLAKLEQEKKDKALLGAFTNAEEIDLARDRNLQFDMIALDNLQQEKAAVQKKQVANNTQVATQQKNKAAIAEELLLDIKRNKAEIARLDQQIQARKQSIEVTRKRFDEDKVRYLQLKGPASRAPEAPPATTKPNEVKP